MSGASWRRVCMLPGRAWSGLLRARGRASEAVGSPVDGSGVPGSTCVGARAHRRHLSRARLRCAVLARCEQYARCEGRQNDELAHAGQRLRVACRAS